MGQRTVALLGHEGEPTTPAFPKRSLDILMQVALDGERFVWFEAIEDITGNNYSVVTVETHPICDSSLPASGIWNLKILYKNKRFQSAFLHQTGAMVRIHTLTDAIGCLTEELGG